MEYNKGRPVMLTAIPTGTSSVWHFVTALWLGLNIDNLIAWSGNYGGSDEVEHLLPWTITIIFANKALFYQERWKFSISIKWTGLIFIQASYKSVCGNHLPTLPAKSRTTVLYHRPFNRTFLNILKWTAIPWESLILFSSWFLELEY